MKAYKHEMVCINVLISYDSVLCVCMCVCTCMCIVWKVDLAYLTWFLQISCSTDCVFMQKEFYTICARCFKCIAVCLCGCSCVMCEFLQGRCSRHVTCMGVRRLGGSVIAEWVITKYRLISFSFPTNIHIHIFLPICLHRFPVQP